MASRRCLPHNGFSYVEALAALLLVAVLMFGLIRIVTNVLASGEIARADHDAIEESRYTLERMVRAVSRSEHLLVPLAENPATTHAESIRDPGVLAVTLDRSRDLDADGFPDADNDGDGRFDEDIAKDATNDGRPGIRGIDDDGDGAVDEGNLDDDDEDGDVDEDLADGNDNDGDGGIDEDAQEDMNDDGEPGISGLDDDGDGLTDEGSTPDDDEDGEENEDWWDPVVFYQAGSTIIERIPVPWDESGGGMDGQDYVEQTLLDNVTQFIVVRTVAPNGGPPLVSIQITRSDSAGQPQTLETIVQAGGVP